MQYPAVGERLKWKTQGKEKRRESDHSRSL
jgi:hypothetical protein